MSFLNRFMDDSPKDTTLDSVIRNLNYVLSARRGYSSQMSDLGLGEYSAEMTSRNVAQKVMEEILDNVAAHEPRLRVHDIISLGTDDALRLMLAMRGYLDGRRCIFQIAFHLPSGAIAVVDARLDEGDGR